MVQEQNYMRRAIRLAKQGIPWASPNPLVGAVIVKKGRVIGEGCHARCGGMHAERAALEAQGRRPAWRVRVPEIVSSRLISSLTGRPPTDMVRNAFKGS